MAICLVVMVTATLILFFDVVFELMIIKARIWLINFSGSLVDSFCSLSMSAFQRN